MQIVEREGRVLLRGVKVSVDSTTTVTPGTVELTVEEAEMLRPDLGPAVRQGSKQPPTDYLRLAIEEARRHGQKARQDRIAQLEAELARLKGSA